MRTSTLSSVQRLAGSVALFNALHEGRKRFDQLYPLAAKAMGTDGYRFTDAWLQRHRRAGEITFERVGRERWWFLTDKGRENHPSSAER